MFTQRREEITEDAKVDSLNNVGFEKKLKKGIFMVRLQLKRTRQSLKSRVGTSSGLCAVAWRFRSLISKAHMPTRIRRWDGLTDSSSVGQAYLTSSKPEHFIRKAA